MSTTTFFDLDANRDVHKWLCTHGTKKITEEFPNFTTDCVEASTALVFNACRDVEKAGVIPTTITISDALEKRGVLEEVGGRPAVSDQSHDIWDAVRPSVGKLMDCYRRRQVAGIGKKLAEGNIPVADALRSLEPFAEAEQDRSLFNAFAKSTIPFTRMKEIGIPERRKILGDWFFEGDLGFVFAPRGLGKTWFSLGLATAINRGDAFGPWKVHETVPVLYVDGEMPLESLEQRIRGMGADEYLSVLNHEALFHKTGAVLNLTSQGSQDAITKLCLEQGFKVLVLDNLSCLFSGIAEDKADAWEAVLPWLLSLRRHRISTIIVHHSGRNGGHMRGTSKREDACFWVIKLDEAGDHGGALRDGARFISRFTKDRNSRVEQVPLEWSFQTDGAGQVSVTTREADGMAVLIQWVADGITSCEDLAREMGVSKGTISKMAKRAIEAGRLRKEGRGYALP